MRGDPKAARILGPRKAIQYLDPTKIDEIDTRFRQPFLKRLNGLR
jgi:hypothetical protein